MSMVEWKELGQLGKFENIGTDKKINEGEHLVTLLNYVDVYHHKFIDSSVPQMRVSASDKKIEACTVEQGDIFVTPSSETVDDIGHSSVITETIPNAVYSYHIMRYRLFKKDMLLSYYINYAFDTENVKKQILKKAQGLTRFGLSKNKFASILIPLPSLSEQTRIVGILDTFTAAMENLKQQIAERRKQYEYYRDKLLDLEGKEGVEMKTLGEICLKITDGSHFSPQAVEQGYYMPSVKDMRSNGFDFSSCKQISKTDYENLVNNGCKPKLNDVLIAKDGSILKYVFPVVEEENIVVLSSIAILTPKQNVINSQFLSYYLIQDKIKERTIREFSSKGGVPRIILKNFKKVNIVYPSLAEQRRIVSILATFEESIQVLEKQLKLREKQYEYYREKLLTFE